MGKKRKFELDLDVEKSMYNSFVTAANAVSEMYKNTHLQQRRATSAASRAMLEKVVTFVLREYPNSDSIPKAALMQYLQYEYEEVEGVDGHAVQELLPAVASVHEDAPSPGDMAHHHHQQQQHHHQVPSRPTRSSSSFPGAMFSPGRRGLSAMTMDDVDEEPAAQTGALPHQHHGCVPATLHPHFGSVAPGGFFGGTAMPPS